MHKTMKEIAGKKMCSLTEKGTIIIEKVLQGWDEEDN